MELHPVPQTAAAAAAHLRYAKDRDPAARDELVRAYEGLVRSLARRFAGRGEALEDLVQVAYVGLLQALERFDPKRGCPFVGFAVPTMIGELKRHFRDRRWKVRVPRALQDRYLAVRAERDDLTQALGRPPSMPDIAEALDLSTDEVVEAMDVGSTFSMASIDASRAGDERRPFSLATNDIGYEVVDDKLLLQGLVAQLGDRERCLLELRFQAEMSQREVGWELGLGQMQVSRLLGRTLASLQRMAAAEVADR